MGHGLLPDQKAALHAVEGNASFRAWVSNILLADRQELNRLLTDEPWKEDPEIVGEDVARLYGWAVHELLAKEMRAEMKGYVGVPHSPKKSKLA